MAAKQEKFYAMLDCGYRKMCVPLDLLDKIVENSYIVSTSYGENGDEMITTVDSLRKFEVITEQELSTAHAQQILAGE